MKTTPSVLSVAKNEEPRADLTPMIDVVFLILIFFLCTLRFRDLEGRLDALLPKDLGRSAGFVPCPLEVSIRVRAPGERRDARHPERPWGGSGPFEYVGRSLSYTLGPRRMADLDALRGHLAGLLARDPEYRLSLDAGPGTVHGDVLPVLDAAIDAGFTNVSIGAVP